MLFITKGDRLKAQSSNFTLAKAPSPKPEVTAATGLTLSDGSTSGEMNLLFKKVQGARSYIYEIAEDGVNAPWVSTTGTVRKTTFYGLVPGKRYNVRVIAVGINGQHVCSQTVTRVAQ